MAGREDTAMKERSILLAKARFDFQKAARNLAIACNAPADIVREFDLRVTAAQYELDRVTAIPAVAA